MSCTATSWPSPPAPGPQFALLPPDNATGNFTKVVQRIAVKIVIDDADGLADRLRPGMSVVARVDARDGAAMSDAQPSRGRRGRAAGGAATDSLAGPGGGAARHLHLDPERAASRPSAWPTSAARVHAGFDEGAWITTAQTVAQMLIAPIAIWIGGVYGPRRVLMEAAAAFAVISFDRAASRPTCRRCWSCSSSAAWPRASSFPLTLSFILRNMPPKYWAYGIAIYALNLELSLNISASLEGWYVDHLSWRWIFWQNVPLALGMALCLHFGVRPHAADPNAPAADVFGLVSCGLGLALIYAALDQGNRLDWLNSGLVWGLLAVRRVCWSRFFVHERRTPHPFLDLKVAFAPPLPRLLLLIGFLRLTILSTAYLIPQYLGACAASARWRWARR